MSPNGEANKGQAITSLSGLLLNPLCVYCQGIWMKHETKPANPQEEKSTPQPHSIDSIVSEARESWCDLFCS